MAHQIIGRVREGGVDRIAVRIPITIAGPTGAPVAAGIEEWIELAPEDVEKRSPAALAALIRARIAEVEARHAPPPRRTPVPTPPDAIDLALARLEEA